MREDGCTLATRWDVVLQQGVRMQSQAKGGEGESGAKDNSGVHYTAFYVFHFLEADMFS